MEGKTSALVHADGFRMQCLQVVRTVDLPDWFIAAGFLRNAIWDSLHGEKQTPLNDIDVVYFDPAEASSGTEKEIETELRSAFPEANWQVKNQARMHVRHGHEPYTSTADAIAHWPEVPTCTGLRLEADAE